MFLAVLTLALMLHQTGKRSTASLCQTARLIYTKEIKVIICVLRQTYEIVEVGEKDPEDQADDRMPSGRCDDLASQSAEVQDGC